MDSSNIQVSGFLLKMRIPFFLVSFIVLFVEFLTSSLRAAEFGTLGPAVIVVGALYVVIMASTSIFFVAMGVQIISRLKSTAESANVKSSSRSRATLRRVRNSGSPVLLSVFKTEIFLSDRQPRW
jgi:hypothetical protein